MFKKPTVAQKEAGIGNRQVVLDHEVYDIIVTAHSSLLHNGKNKTFDGINDQYYGIVRAEVCIQYYHKTLLY